MPYISPSHRVELDALIDQLADRVVQRAQADGYDGAFAGLLNYTCTRLALQVVRRQFGALRYWLLSLLCGTFQNIGAELYRRLGGPYEDRQLAKNGDVDLLAEYCKEIENNF